MQGVYSCRYSMVLSLSLTKLFGSCMLGLPGFVLYRITFSKFCFGIVLLAWHEWCYTKQPWETFILHTVTMLLRTLRTHGKDFFLISVPGTRNSCYIFLPEQWSIFILWVMNYIIYYFFLHVGCYKAYNWIFGPLPLSVNNFVVPTCFVFYPDS